MEAVIRQFREMMLAALQESGNGTKRSASQSLKLADSRRGDRMKRNVRYWHKADILVALNNVRFWG
jgi:hypothetical protein